MRIEPQRPEIGKRGVAKGRELRGEHDFAVAPQGNAFGIALLEGIVIRLAPETRMFGQRGHHAEQKRGDQGHCLRPGNAAATVGRWRNKLRHRILSNRSRKTNVMW